ncbi:MAG: DUF4126 domain-containing protein [Prochlorotrichaceae cyanobacterium]
MIDILAALSASAAGGMRVGLPLLLIGLLQSERLWSQVPILARFHPQVVVSILVSWSIFELVAAKSLLGQRVQQNLQLFLSPVAGSILGLTVANNRELPPGLTGILGGVGGIFALVIYLVQAGWFYRLRGIPLWAAIVEDILCVSLVFMAFGAPRQGGLLALLLLWLALRTSSQWRNWYVHQGDSPHPSHNSSQKLSPRQGKLEPD